MYFPNKISIMFDNFHWKSLKNTEKSDLFAKVLYKCFQIRNLVSLDHFISYQCLSEE